MKDECDADPQSANSIGVAIPWFAIMAFGISMHLLIPEVFVAAFVDSSLVSFVAKIVPNIDAWATHSAYPDRARVGLTIQWLLVVPLIPASWNYVCSYEGWFQTLRNLSVRRRVFGVPFLLLCIAVMVLIPEASDLKPEEINGIGIHHLLTRIALKSALGMSLMGAMQVGGAAIALVYIYGLVFVRQLSEQKLN